jgi:hypothetical protein
LNTDSGVVTLTEIMIDQEIFLYIQIKRCIRRFPLDQVSEYLKPAQSIGKHILNNDGLPFCANSFIIANVSTNQCITIVLLLFEVEFNLP